MSYSPYVITSEYSCPLCGWWLIYNSTQELSWDHYEVCALKTLDINSAKLELGELGAHLKNNPSDIYWIEPRRFEELVADIFRNQGYRIVLTQPAKDDGADILVLHNDKEGVSAIIECKKYARHRKIGVELIRTLVGAAIHWDVRKASLVTTSDFTSVAREQAEVFNRKGFAIDLVAMTDILKLLNVYNENLPSLDKLTQGARKEIIEANLTRR